MPTNRPIRRPNHCLSVQTLELLESRRLLSAGLTAEYFDNPDFTGQSVSRTDSTINFDWGRGSPSPLVGSDYFSARWQGTITAPQTQTYTIRLTADDGARLWIDGQLLIDSWYSGGAATAQINLTANQPKGLLVEYREKIGDASIRLEWSSPSTPWQVIPASSLSTLNRKGAPLKIMALGDSVTEADTDHASYRFWLHHQLLSAGYAFDMVGTRNGNHIQGHHNSQGEPKYPWFDRDHQSRWGAKLSEWQASMDQWASQNPDVILIHIGHNDIRGGVTPSQMIAQLDAFIDQLRVRVNPDIKIILAQPITNFKYHEVVEDMDAYRAMMPGLAAAKNTARSPVVVVDQATGFVPNLHTYDQTHPNEAGEKLIASRFFDAIVKLVGRPTLAPTPPATPQVADISGFVFDDANGNGVQDSGEAGLAGRFVYLDYNNNGQRDDNEPVLATNKNGRYLFKSVPVGNYRVRHHLGHFAVATQPSTSQHIVRLGEFNATNAWNFGVRTTPPVTTRITGTVFFDINGNGIRGINDNGIANRYVFIDANNNGIFDANERYAVTDANGQFTFNNLAAGTYQIRVHAGPAVRPTTPFNGVYTLTIVAGQTLANRDFGLTLV